MRLFRPRAACKTRRRVLAGMAAITLGSIVPRSWATQYLTVEQAQKAIFPEADKFQPRPLRLTEDQKRAIATKSEGRVRNADVPLWEARSGARLVGYFIVDEVIGKHEFITYAIGLLA